MTSQKEMVKLVEYCENATTSTTKSPRLFLVTSVSELLNKGSASFNLSDRCQIITPDGNIVADNEVLFFLNSLGTTFFIREETTASDTSHSTEPTHEKEMCPMIQEEANIVINIAQEDAGNQQSREFEHGVTDASKITKSSSLVPDFDGLLEGDFYPVLDILRKSREGVRGDAADTIITRLKSSCSEKDEQFLVNAAGSWLMSHCEKRKFYPTKAELTKMAKSICIYFPSAACSSLQPSWVLLYDPRSGRGKLETYIRNKRFRTETSEKRQTNKKIRTLQDLPTESYSEEDIKAFEEFMRTTPLHSRDKSNNNRVEMLDAMTKTRNSRREFLKTGKRATATVFLNKYPRLRDMPEAVHAEFLFLKKSTIECFLENWRRVEKEIVRYAISHCKGSEAKRLIDSAEKADNEFDSKLHTQCVFQILLFLVPNKQPAQKKKGATHDAWPLVMESFHEVILPEEAAKRAKGMVLPGVLDINGQFFIKVDDSAIMLTDIKTIEEAIATLVMYYYILDINFPPTLKFFYGFLERLFQILPTSESINMKRLSAFLCLESL